MKIKQNKWLLLGKIVLIFSLLGFWVSLSLNFQIWVNNDKNVLWVHAPTVVEEQEEFELIIEAWDGYERLAGSYKGEVSFSLESYDYNTLTRISSLSNLPDDYIITSNYDYGGIYPSYKIKGADNGKATFDLSISTPGIHYIIVKEITTGDEYRSNPILVSPKDSNVPRVFWGDIHGHTLYSDGSGTPQESYQYARDIACLDYAALTDHSEHFSRMGEIDVFNQFETYVQITNSYNDPGTFTTLVAMEWTPDYVVRGREVANGHLNFYFSGDDMPFFSTFTHQNPNDLYDYIKSNTNDEFMAWTHHANIGQFGSDFGIYDERINRLVEIYSIHGCSEISGEDNLVQTANEIQLPGYSIRDAFKMGRKMGIMSSSDTHDGRLGHCIVHTDAKAYNQYPFTLAGYRLYHQFPGGLTGVYADELTRSSIFNGLYGRSCCASTWVNRPYIEFKINGLSVGENNSTLDVSNKNSARTIELLVASDGVAHSPNVDNTIERINIYKNSELWKTISPDSSIYRTTLLDTEEITGTSYDSCIEKDGKYYIHKDSIQEVDPSELNTGGQDYYYLRAEFSNDGIAWIGPIWVNPLKM